VAKYSVVAQVATSGPQTPGLTRLAPPTVKSMNDIGSGALTVATKKIRDYDWRGPPVRAGSRNARGAWATLSTCRPSLKSDRIQALRTADRTKPQSRK